MVLGSEITTDMTTKRKKKEEEIMRIKTNGNEKTKNLTPLAELFCVP